jgi:hypothetical protein
VVDTGAVAKARQERTPDQLLADLGPLVAPPVSTDDDTTYYGMVRPTLAGSLRPHLLDLHPVCQADVRHLV